MSEPIEEFWRSWKGLLARLADISHNMAWGTFNAATKEYLGVLEDDPATAKEWADSKLRWDTMGDPKVCELCQDNEGEYDPGDPLLPDMPAHVVCRCWWTIV